MGEPRLSHFAPSNDQLGAQLATLIGNVGAGSGPTSGLTEAAANALYRRLSVNVPAADIDGLSAVIDPRINPVARAGDTTLWPKTKLPTDVAYVGTIGSGRSLPATGAQVGDYFLLTRGETTGPVPNRRASGLYRRGTTAWEAVTLGGISQTAADARYVRTPAGRAFPASPAIGDAFVLTRGFTTGTPPNTTDFVSGLYRRTATEWVLQRGLTQNEVDLRIDPVARVGSTARWPLTKLPEYGAGASFPSSPSSGDYFLLTKGETTGPVPNRRASGLYRRGASSWELVSLGTTGSGRAFPSSPVAGQWFLLTRDIVTTRTVPVGAVPTVATLRTATLRASPRIVGWNRTSGNNAGNAGGSVSPLPPTGYDAIYWFGGATLRAIVPSAVVATPNTEVATITIGTTSYRMRAGFNSNILQASVSSNPFTNSSITFVWDAGYAQGLPANQLSVFGGTIGTTRTETTTTTSAGLYRYSGTVWESRAGLSQTQADARYVQLTRQGAGATFPTSPAPQSGDFFLLTKNETTGSPANRRAAGLYRRGTSAWEQVNILTQTTADGRYVRGPAGSGTAFPSSPSVGDWFLLTRPIATPPPGMAAGLYRRTATGWEYAPLGISQAAVDDRVEAGTIQQARAGDTTRWPKSKLPADTSYGTVNGVGDRLPTTGMLFNDRFLLRRGYSVGSPPNTTNVFPGLYRRGNTAWALALGQGAPVSMWSKGDTLTLNRSELTPLVFDMGYTYGAVLTAGPAGSPGLGSGWRSRGTLTGGSATGSVSIAPTGGLYGIEDGLGAEIWVASTKVPSAVSINGVRRTLSATDGIPNIYTSSGSGYPRFESGTAVNVQVEYSDGSFAWPNTQSDGRGSGSGITQTAADARYAPIAVAGNALPTTGFNTGDYFLLRRAVSGPGGQGTLNAGLYRRTASAWELQVLGTMGVGTALPATANANDMFFPLARIRGSRRWGQSPADGRGGPVPLHQRRVGAGDEQRRADADAGGRAVRAASGDGLRR